MKLVSAATGVLLKTLVPRNATETTSSPFQGSSLQFFAILTDMAASSTLKSDILSKGVPVPEGEKPSFLVESATLPSSFSYAAEESSQDILILGADSMRASL